MYICRKLQTETHFISGSTGGVPGARPPMGPNSFVFTNIFTEKGPHQRSTPPPLTGNPGSATAFIYTSRYILLPVLIIAIQSMNWAETCFGVFINNMLPSKLIKICSIIDDSFVINSFTFLAKIQFDSMSFT